MTTTDPCEHVATLTTNAHVAFGPWIDVTGPMTVCVTCHDIINRED